MKGSLINSGSLTQARVDAWVAQTKAKNLPGRIPDYIPQLGLVDRHWLALQIQLAGGQSFAAGDTDRRFALMSVVKPFTLLFLLELLGQEAVFKRVGVLPSDQPFHSLTQLKADQGFPRNPMINSGAIALADQIPGADGAACCETLRQWLNRMSGANMVLDEAMLASVRSVENETNRAIARLLHQSGYLDSVEIALDTYNHICCLSGTVHDLAQLGLLLATPQTALKADHQRTVNALMLTCGLYEASAAFAIRIGLPAKSGVSGAILAILPGQGAIACYSPVLDQTGSSVAGLFLLEQLTSSLGLSLFG